jgi:hypothetical protein
VRKAIAATVVAVVFGIALGVRPAAADADSKCNGQVVAGIAATWPWAHDDKAAFPPPPGAIALWIKEFGPLVGVSSVRELQLLFCSPT